jgi:hypothetical protein
MGNLNQMDPRQGTTGIIEDSLSIYDGPADVDELWESRQFFLRCGVKVGINAKTMRTRQSRTSPSCKFVWSHSSQDFVLDVLIATKSDQRRPTRWFGDVF